jgi:predicted CXXCH cytochrome family protein
LNEGLGTCTRCHSIPEETYELGGGVKFTHDLAYERGVDCANCHSDLVRGNGEVPVERCNVCHDRHDDLSRINDHEFMHQTHVTDHKVDCLDCHLEIRHSLDPHTLEHAAADCQSCHPEQHRDQILMLRGEGAKSIGPRHGGMAVTGMSCPSCHQRQRTAADGNVLWQASTAACTQCHDEAASIRLLAVHDQLKDTLASIEAAILQARNAIPAANLDETAAASVTQRLREMDDDVRFMRVGNSIHNMHYADSLARALVDKIVAVSRELGIAEPQINLPEPLDQ